MQQATIDLTLPDGRSGTGTITLPDPAPAAKPTPAPAPDPAPTSRIEVGVNAAVAEYGTWFKAFPQAAFGRVFSPDGKGLPNLAGPAVTQLGRTPWISHKDPVPVDQVVAVWLALAKLLGKGRVARWTFRHEGENYDLATHRSYYRDLRAARDDHGLAGVIRLVDIRTLYACRYKSGVNWREWMLPGVVDEVGWDCYAPTNWPTYEPFESLFGLPIASAAEFGMDLSIPEVGAVKLAGDTDGTQRGRYLAAGVDYLAAHRVKAVGLWCAKDGNLEYRPTTAPELALWKSILTKYAP